MQVDISFLEKKIPEQAYKMLSALVADNERHVKNRKGRIVQQLVFGVSELYPSHSNEILTIFSATKQRGNEGLPHIKVIEKDVSISGKGKPNAGGCVGCEQDKVAAVDDSPKLSDTKSWQDVESYFLNDVQTDEEKARKNAIKYAEAIGIKVAWNMKFETVCKRIYSELVTQRERAARIDELREQRKNAN